MSDDSVSRQAAIDGILHLMPPNPNMDDGSAEQLNFSAWKCALTCAEASIKMMPSAQPQPCKDAVSKADVLETYAELYDVFDDNKEIKNELHKIYDKINALQAAQPQRIKGKWIHTSNIIGYGRCSACGSLWNESLVENKFFRFCPRCGADMRGEQE